LVFRDLGKNILKLVKSSDIVRLSDLAFKLMSLTVFIDGLQVTGAAIMRSVGGQAWGILMDILGFYVVGIPLGAYLMLKTDWTIKGYWFGLFVGCAVVFLSQLIYINRINWKKEAEKVFYL
jgi:MATE family multidrug resistance protein